MNLPEKIEIDELWGFKLNELGEKFNSLIDYLHSQKEEEKCEKLVNHYGGAHLCQNPKGQCPEHDEKKSQCNDCFDGEHCHGMVEGCNCGCKPTEQEEWEEKFVEQYGYLFQKGEIMTGKVILFIRNLLSHSRKQAKEQKSAEIHAWAEANKFDGGVRTGYLVRFDELKAFLNK